MHAPSPAIEIASRVLIKPRRAEPFFNRHPWVFSGAIHHVGGDPQPGDVVEVYSHDKTFIGRGLFNPHSNIRVRLYTWNEAESLDRDFWSRRLDAAIALRRQLDPAPGSTNAERLVYSEADGLSGLVVDRYADWLLVQWTSRALSQHSAEILELLTEKLHPAGIWLRTEKGIRESEGLETADGLISGTEPERPLFIEENGVRYGVDVVQGQKTGFFLDQRDNRTAITRYVRGHKLLDLFCYSGGFGLNAVLRGGAAEVHGIDASETAVALARANAELNGVADKCHYAAKPAFEALEEFKAKGERFDTVILDPPKMTRHRSGIPQALRGYHSLNRLAVDVLKPGGILVTCSCSGLISRDEFEAMLADVSLRTDRPIQILEARGQSTDHPTSTHCHETAYLKCYICRVG